MKNPFDLLPLFENAFLFQHCGNGLILVYGDRLHVSVTENIVGGSGVDRMGGDNVVTAVIVAAVSGKHDFGDVGLLVKFEEHPILCHIRQLFVNKGSKVLIKSVRTCIVICISGHIFIVSRAVHEIPLFQGVISGARTERSCSISSRAN